MIFAELSAPNPESPVLAIFKRLCIAALVVPLAWGSLVYCFRWIVSRWITQPEKDGIRAEKTGILCIVFSILSSATAVFVVPKLSNDGTLVTNIIMWYHRFGVALLGDFLLLALVFQLKYSLQSGKWNYIGQARTVFNSWRWITETMPGPSAIIILFTGMQRVSVPGFSLNLGWILFLVAILAIMMADGIFSYTPAIRNLATFAEQNDNIHNFLTRSRNPLRNFKLLVHSLSFPIVLTIPVWKIEASLSVLKPLLDKFHLNQTQGGWQQVLPALVVFAVLFIIVATLNRWGKQEG